MSTLDMGNVTDGEVEQLIRFAKTVAGLQQYGDEMECDGEDAMDCLNEIIEEARDITRIAGPCTCDEGGSAGCPIHNEGMSCTT